jgi:hypothetical protein
MEINGILNKAEESLFTEDVNELESLLVQVEGTASRITAAMMTPA